LITLAVIEMIHLLFSAYCCLPSAIILFSLCLWVSVASFQRLRRSDSRPASIVSIGVEKEKRT
jgi:hypothetical protein